MESIIPALLVLSTAHAQHHIQFISHKQPTLETATPRLEPLDRSGYTINHGDAKSSVNFNLGGSEVSQEYNPSGGSQGEELQNDAPNFGGTGGYLTDLASKQYMNINPNNIAADQSYNVGYSINISNHPKILSYRSPNPPPLKNAHSYRQQKLLNADIITGTNKDAVQKPHFNFGAPNYIPQDPQKQTVTKVYADVHNTHGYTWKSLSPGVEISGYHTLSEMSPEKQSKNFDHAGALARSQGFGISNVVDKNYTPEKEYSSQGYTPEKEYIPKAEPLTINKDFHDNSGVDDSVVDLKFDQHNFNQFKSTDFDFNSGFKFDSLGSNIEVDKTLLEGFYKNYNPSFYQPEITLPSPHIPKSIHLNLHSSASQQIPQYQPTSFKNPQLNMINQHYAFVQANSADTKPNFDQLQEHIQAQIGQDQNGQGQNGQSQNGQEQYGQGQNLQGQLSQLQSHLRSEIKPVTEQAEDSYGQYSQKIAQQIATTSAPILVNFKEQKVKNVEHKKYLPSPQTGHHNLGGHHHIPFRQYARPVVVYDKNYRLKNLRPPPMIYIKQKY